MFRPGNYMQYGPVICIGIVLAVLFVLWTFWGGNNYEFVGLAPLSPDTCGSYTGSLYDWGNITPAAGYDPVEDRACIPPDVVCVQEVEQFTEQKPIIQTKPITKKGKFVSRGERLCCQTMERIYGVPFINVRPSWLLNHTGRALELDCYNDDLQLAVEYNGEQHYKWPNFTNQSFEEFQAQLDRDTLKMELCDKRGVYLIVVPYTVEHDNIPAYIISHLPETIQKRLQEERTMADIT